MTAASLAGEPADALAVWCRIRRQISWSGVQAPPAAAPASNPDGLTAWLDGPVRRRDPARADRLLSATALSREAAARGEPLTLPLLGRLQALVLGVPEVPLRRSDAFAKAGRERYGLTPHTWHALAHCLRQSADPTVPLPARAARAYLDVAFFHPFPDGNGRLALLALTHVLELDGIRLPLVEPLQTTRYADDPDGALDLAVLVGILIRATGRPPHGGERLLAGDEDGFRDGGAHVQH